MTTVEAARLLGMAVRSVQHLVDRGQLDAWRTPGGHRRILRESVERFIARRNAASRSAPAGAAGPRTRLPRAQGASADRPVILYIEDSAHFQRLVAMVVRQSLPHAELHVASDGIVGLAMAGELQPDIMIVDLLLPGIDGVTLISRLREHAPLAHTQLVVLTSLEPAKLQAYAIALEGLPVIHKSDVMERLPALLTSLSGTPQATAR